MKKKSKRQKITTVKFKTQVQKFKKSVESKIGPINWSKLGIYSLLIVIYIASRGLLGPKAKIAALTLYKLYRSTKVV